MTEFMFLGLKILSGNVWGNNEAQRVLFPEVLSVINASCSL